VPFDHVTVTLPPATSYSFNDVVNDFTNFGANCPTNKTCYNTMYTYYIQAVDVQGTVSVSSISVSASVPHYTFIGFANPLTSDGGNGGNFTIGNPIQVMWQLTAAGAFVSNLAAVTSITVGYNSTPTNGTCPVTTSFQSSITLYPGSTLTYNTSTNQFVFNWNTTGRAAGCYTLQLQLNDSSPLKTNRLRLR